MRSAPALASALLLVLLPVASAGSCWGFDGKKWGGNSQCEGSLACCGDQGICLPNKLCNSNKNGTGEIIRGTCATAPYDPVECAEICLYDEPDGRFPRVTICDDGKYCCDNDKDCCSRGRGVFLNDVGNVVETDPSISSSSKTTVTESPSSTPSSSDSVGPATPPTPNPVAPSPSAPAAPAVQTAASGGLATGAKIGIGVAVPVAVLGAAALAAFLWFRNKKKVYSTTSSGEYKTPSQQQQLPHELPQELPQELAAKESAQELQGFAKEQSNVAIELDAGEVGGGGKTEYKPYVRGAE